MFHNLFHQILRGIHRLICLIHPHDKVHHFDMNRFLVLVELFRQLHHKLLQLYFCEKLVELNYLGRRIFFHPELKGTDVNKHYCDTGFVVLYCNEDRDRLKARKFKKNL